MFGRGNWAILGLAKESLEAFQTALDDRNLMVASSQMAASAVTRQFGADALGINPYSAPRLDEEHPLDSQHFEDLARYATTEQQARAELALPAEVLDCEGYGAAAPQFRLHAELPWYGLWAVSNEWKDVSDVASVKEQRSYTLMERPYRFLQAVDKKNVDQEALGATAAVRKQVPVLLDFNEGRLYVESNNKKLIHAVVVRIQQLGAVVIPVAWTYTLPNWPSEILNKLYERTQFKTEFLNRAEEATRFKPNEIEKLEDREVESIVANYFSMSELESELWAGISGPAQVRLHDASPSIGVKAPTTATTLLHMTDDAAIVSGALTFQERVTLEREDGGARAFRRDVLCVEVSDRFNMTEVGAAMLRGFDLPAVRKDIQNEIRKTKQVPSIEQFWGTWLHELSNAVRTIEAAFRELLAIDGVQQAGILPMQLPGKDEKSEAAVAN